VYRHTVKYLMLMMMMMMMMMTMTMHCAGTVWQVAETDKQSARWARETRDGKCCDAERVTAVQRPAVSRRTLPTGRQGLRRRRRTPTPRPAEHQQATASGLLRRQVTAAAKRLHRHPRVAADRPDLFRASNQWLARTYYSPDFLCIPVSAVASSPVRETAAVEKGGLRSFGHDTSWVKRYTTAEVYGTRQKRRTRKIWQDSVKDMKGLGLSQEDAQSRNKWRRKIKRKTG